MISFEDRLMFKSGHVGHDSETEKQPSRGFYIVANDSFHYLHTDGAVRASVKHNGVYSFWPTFEEADKFLSDWRASFDQP